MIYEEFVRTEKQKQLGGVKILYPQEDIPLVNIEYDKEKNLKPIYDDQLDFRCLYDLNYKPEDGKNCANIKDKENFIQKNKILWARFNDLKNYKYFAKPPTRVIGVYDGMSLFLLAEIKAIDILQMAEKGDIQQAAEEWARYMNLYRMMVNDKTMMSHKAMFMISLGIHHVTFKTLLYKSPEITSYKEDLEKVLQPGGIELFRGQYMLSDDFGYIEPSFISQTGISGQFRSLLYKCFLDAEKQAKLDYFNLPKKSEEHVCYKYFPHDPWKLVFKAFTDPGNLYVNATNYLLVGGLLKGLELITNMHRTDAAMRMSLLALEIIDQKIPEKDIPAFIQNAPPELQNSLTNEPFDWDTKERKLYFLRDPGDKESEWAMRIPITKH